ncbi:MAG: hypothetical protein DHS20C14_10490 [Phycisphaeraceae bacterium]|nr:MAG: hypothetical protein DHS20C14_10490 [Phycisphaeraceae bacterium]
MTASIHTSRRAFSLIEILMVIVIMGVLAAVVVPGIGALDAQRQDAAIEEIKRSLRFARGSAMATGAPTGVQIQTSSGVVFDAVRIDPDTLALDGVPGPLGEDFPTRYLSSEFPGITLASVTNGDGSATTDETIWFKFDGTPHTRNGSGVFTSDNASDCAIEVDYAGGTRTIVVHAFTGFVDEL